MKKIHRVSFDFGTKKDAVDFVDVMLQRMNVDFGLVHKDALHDVGKSVHEYMVRNADDAGNGRPVV